MHINKTPHLNNAASDYLTVVTSFNRAYFAAGDSGQQGSAAGSAAANYHPVAELEGGNTLRRRLCGAAVIEIERFAGKIIQPVFAVRRERGNAGGESFRLFLALERAKLTIVRNVEYALLVAGNAHKAWVYAAVKLGVFSLAARILIKLELAVGDNFG